MGQRCQGGHRRVGKSRGQGIVQYITGGIKAVKRIERLKGARGDKKSS